MDVSLFSFSTQDYVLRGLSSLYAPLLVLGMLAFGGLGAHRLVVRALASPRFGDRRRQRLIVACRWLTVVTAAIASACVLYTWEGNAASPRWPVPTIGRAISAWRWTVPALLIVATLGGLYTWWLRRQLVADRSRPPTWATVVSTLVIVSTVALGFFWVLEDHASTIGRRNADLLRQQVATLP